jgi:hypothetical protein
MENQTINTPPQSDGSAGANTVLLVVIILILGGLAFWWFSNENKVETPEDNTSVLDVNVTLPESNEEGADGTE